MNDQGKGSTSIAALERASEGATRLDEFLRRQLGVADVNDPALVVGALRKRYPTTAARLEEESRGMPVRFAGTPEPSTPVATGCAESPAMLRFREVRPALEADVVRLVQHPASRGFEGALEGWRDACLTELDEGGAAAEQAADPASQDRMFYSVRKLGDFARVARLAGLLNPELTGAFRRVALTLENGAIIQRVRAGEVLLQAGFDGDGHAFQVPLHDLRQRREALLGAVERFSVERAEQDGDWGMREASYAALLETLERQGSRDLRVLLRRDTLARLLDVLLKQPARERPGQLHGLASTAPIELVQLRRLLVAATATADARDASREDAGEASANASGPLISLIQSLRLFTDAFTEPSTGTRLLDLALPAPFVSRQHLRGDEASDVVRRLFQVRAELSNDIESLYLDPNLDPEEVRLPVFLDRILYDVDRCIDLFLTSSAREPSQARGRRLVPGQEHARRYGRALESFMLHGRGRDIPDKAPLRARLVGLGELLLGRPLSPNEPDVTADEEAERLFGEQRDFEWTCRSAALQLAHPLGDRRGLLEVVVQQYLGDRRREGPDRVPVASYPEPRAYMKHIVRALRERPQHGHPGQH